MLVPHLLLLFPLVAPGTRDPELERLDGLFEHCASNGMLNGVVLVKRGGETVYSRAFGFADPRDGRALDVDSAFYLASVSKQFTSMAAMVLAEAEVLRLDDRLADYFPGFEGFAGDVRLHHLMTHTSGVPDHYRLLGEMPESLNNEDVRALLVEHGALDFEPGSEYRYSNGGYVMLAMCIARAAEADYREVLEERIFAPLGMERTLVYDEREPAVENRAHGFRPDGALDDYTLHTTGAGGMYSTVGDLALWDDALHDGVLVSEELMELAYTPPELPDGKRSSYGFGWVVAEHGGGRLAMHSGGLAGFSTLIVRSLESRNTLILLSNQAGTLVDTEELSGAVDAIVSGREVRLPRVRLSGLLRRLIDEEGIDAALERHDELWRQRATANVDLGESQLNALGYEFLNKGDLDVALALFERNTDVFPDAANAWDSLGEAQLKGGARDAALASYRRALELNPGLASARSAIAGIEAESR